MLLAVEIVIVETLRHQSGSIREHRGLVVVAIAVQRVDAVVFPQPSVDFVFLLKVWGKVHQDGYRLTRNSPTTHFDLQALLLSLPLPIGKERTVFLEIGTFTFLPAIRTNKDNMVLHFLLEGLRTR